MKTENYNILSMGDIPYGVSESGDVIKSTGYVLKYSNGTVRISGVGRVCRKTVLRFRSDEPFQVEGCPSYKPPRVWSEWKRKRFPPTYLDDGSVKIEVRGLPVLLDLEVYENYCKEDRLGSLGISFSGRDGMDDYVMVVIRGLGSSNRARLHRLIVTVEEGHVTDHINGNRRDNRRDNLRSCTHLENCNNRHYGLLGAWQLELLTETEL